MPGGGEGHGPARIVELRTTSLERAGFDRAAAGELAARTDIPLQEALNLVKAGFPPGVAYGLLTSGDRPVF